MATKKKAKRSPARRKRPAARKRPAPKRHARHRPETFRARGVTVSLTVNDLPRSTAWYTNTLGFAQASKWEDGGVLQGVELKAGTTRVILNQDDWAKGRDRQKGLGMSLYFSTAQNLDHLAERIRTNGGTLDRGPERTSWGSYSFSLTDPDGFKLTFTQLER
ncbi:MAG TPA: VOC family protein [Gemmatimonadales bacterium]|nr:VOC family protein [Gemmatimonadales bacterium]